MAETTDDKILKRLDQILMVLALKAASEKSITDGARLLKIAGLDNKTIARLLGTTDATVRTLTANLHRKKLSS